jgi:hypothetical protein
MSLSVRTRLALRLSVSCIMARGRMRLLGLFDVDFLFGFLCFLWEYEFQEAVFEGGL